MNIGIDLGNKSRNAIAVLNEDILLEWSALNFNEAESAYHHRQNICKQIREYIEKYDLTKDDYLLFEQIFFYRGLSRMSNVTSMAFLQATIINEFSDDVSISEVHVQSWKSKVLGSRSAKKEDAIKYVETNYPEVNLDIIIHHARKDDEIVKDHDIADAICIGLYGSLVSKNKLDDNLVNYT